MSNSLSFVETNDPVVLDSSEPFEDNHITLKSFLWRILKATILSVILVSFLEDIFGAKSNMVLIGIIPAVIVMAKYVWSNCQMIVKFRKMHNIRFKFIKVSALDEVYPNIESELTPINCKVEKNESENFIAVTYDGVQYNIFFNNDETFSIKWQKSDWEKILFFVVDLADGSIYDSYPYWKFSKICIGTPLIAYKLQKAYNIQA